MRKSTKQKFIWALIFLGAIFLHAPASLANNLQISDFRIYSIDTANNLITLQFDVSWDNSWRDTNNAPYNYDAVWIFFKYATSPYPATDPGDDIYKTATLSASGTNPSAFTIPSNFEVIVPTDKVGLFLERTDTGKGDVSASNIRVKWDYGTDGVTDTQAQSSSLDIKIFGLEMVYVPQGAFYAGDGGNVLKEFVQGSSDTDPWYVNSEGTINVTNAVSNGYYYYSTGGSADDADGATFTIPAAFPKGYNAFYIMKYELTEGQWVDFINTLWAQARLNLDITANDATLGGKNSDASADRNTVSFDSSITNGIALTRRPRRAVSYLSWVDALAYADWAGLRPMTELEYEKAARGADQIPNLYEYASSSDNVNSVDAGDITPNADEDGAETVGGTLDKLVTGNISYTSGDGRAGGLCAGQKGPLRVGIFATNRSGRTLTGAGYYGAMELSGNLSEQTVTVGNDQGRAFEGTHGDGNLANGVSACEGKATNTDWPGYNSGDGCVEGTRGSGSRGGSYINSTAICPISSRAFAGRDPEAFGYKYRYDAGLVDMRGGRFVRTAP